MKEDYTIPAKRIVKYHKYTPEDACGNEERYMCYSRAPRHGEHSMKEVKNFINEMTAYGSRTVHRGFGSFLAWWLLLGLAWRKCHSLQEPALGEGLQDPPHHLVGGATDVDPDFRGPQGNVTVAVGKEAVLTCSVTELGHYKVGWMKVEDQTILSLHNKVVTHNSRISVTSDNHHTWRLHIRQVKEADRGCYMCQINTNVMKKQVVCLDVHVPPDILDEETSSDVTVKEGENATLVCRATGHPHPRITWKREDGTPLVLNKNIRDFTRVETFSGDELSLMKLNRKQMGAYMCIASNDVPPAVSKRIVLSIHFPPKVTVPNQLLGAPLGTDVHIDCYVEAYPTTINYWVKNRGEMLLNGNRHTIEKSQERYKIHLELTIKSFRKEDVGTYMCVSRNSLGHADGTVRLYDIKIVTRRPDETTNIAVFSDNAGFDGTRANIDKDTAKQVAQRTKGSKPLMEESALGRSSASEDDVQDSASERSGTSMHTAYKCMAFLNTLYFTVFVHVVR